VCLCEECGGAGGRGGGACTLRILKCSQHNVSKLIHKGGGGMVMPQPSKILVLVRCPRVMPSSDYAISDCHVSAGLKPG
jgi:hypothetical protein